MVRKKFNFSFSVGLGKKTKMEILQTAQHHILSLHKAVAILFRSHDLGTSLERCNPKEKQFLANIFAIMQLSGSIHQFQDFDKPSY